MADAGDYKAKLLTHVSVIPTFPETLNSGVPHDKNQGNSVFARLAGMTHAALIADWTPEWMAPERLKALEAIDLGKLPEVTEGVRIGAPLAGIRAGLAIGTCRWSCPMLASCV